MRVPPLAFLASAALAVAWRPAHACEPAVPTPHTLDATSTDRVPPSLTAAPVKLARSKRTQMGCDGSQTVDSCGDLATLMVTPASSDDQTPPAEMGYRIRLMTGSLPSGLILPTGDVRTQGGLVPLPFTDSDRSAPLSFVLSVAAVDRAGNVSPALSVPVVDEGDGAGRDSGSDGGGGCTLASGSAVPSGAFLALAALLLGRIGRRRR